METLELANIICEVQRVYTYFQQPNLWPFKEALYRIWCGVNRLGDSGLNRLGDTSAFVN